MSKHILKYLTTILTLLALAACGGGGGGGQGPAASPTTATFKIILSGDLPANTAISGAGFTLTLPADVTPAMVNGIVAGDVVTPSGTFDGGIVTPLIYAPATATSAGTVMIALASANPSGITQAGEVATVTLQLANGAAPTVAGFAIDSTVKVIDLLYNPIIGLHAIVSDLRLN